MDVGFATSGKRRPVRSIPHIPQDRSGGSHDVYDPLAQTAGQGRPARELIAGARRNDVGDRLHPHWGRGDRRRGRQGGRSRNAAPAVPIPPTGTQTRGGDRRDRGGRRSCVQSTGPSGQVWFLRGRPGSPGLGLEACLQPASVVGRSGAIVGHRGRGYRRVRRCRQAGPEPSGHRGRSSRLAPCLHRSSERSRCEL